MLGTLTIVPASGQTPASATLAMVSSPTMFDHITAFFSTATVTVDATWRWAERLFYFAAGCLVTSYFRAGDLRGPFPTGTAA